MTAEELFQDLKHLPAAERQKFFIILSAKAFSEENDSTTRKAIAELEAGKGKRFASVDALMADLHADD